MRLGVSYHGSRRLDHVERDLDAIVASGASVVVHCVPEDDIAYRRTRVDQVVAASKARGLEVLLDPWAVLGLFGGEALSFAMSRDPEIRQRLSDGRLVPGACPNHRRTATWLRRWVDAAVSSGADGVLWDEPHLWIPSWDDWTESAPDAWSCTCGACRSAWAAGRHGAPGGPFPAVLAPELRAFRARTLLGLLDDAMGIVRAAGMRNVLTALPVEPEAPEAIPWESLMAMPALDGIGADPYWFLHERPVDEYVGTWSTRVSALACGAGLRSHLWVALFGVPPDRADELTEAVAIAATAGIDDLFAWSWPGGAVPHERTLPEADAWALVSAAVASSAPRAPGGPA